MGASSRFYLEMKEREQYGNVSLTIDLLMFLKKNYIEDVDFVVNEIKEKNSLYNDNELIKENLNKQYKLQRELREIKHKINHNKRNYE